MPESLTDLLARLTEETWEKLRPALQANRNELNRAVWNHGINLEENVGEIYITGAPLEPGSVFRVVADEAAGGVDPLVAWPAPKQKINWREYWSGIAASAKPHTFTPRSRTRSPRGAAP